MIATLFIAITAFTYSYILTRPNQILAWPYRKLDELFKTDERKMNHGKGPHPIFMMIMYCEKCVSGQMALWAFLFFNYQHYNFYTLLYHVAFVCTTIFLVTIIKTLYLKFID